MSQHDSLFFRKLSERGGGIGEATLSGLPNAAQPPGKNALLLAVSRLQAVYPADLVRKSYKG